jgi:hypothetical protein
MHTSRWASGNGHEDGRALGQLHELLHIYFFQSKELNNNDECDEIVIQEISLVAKKQCL